MFLEALMELQRSWFRVSGNCSVPPLLSTSRLAKVAADDGWGLTCWGIRLVDTGPLLAFVHQNKLGAPSHGPAAAVCWREPLCRWALSLGGGGTVFCHCLNKMHARQMFVFKIISLPSVPSHLVWPSSAQCPFSKVQFVESLISTGDFAFFVQHYFGLMLTSDHSVLFPTCCRLP